MKLVYPLIIFAMMGLIIPVYAQDSRMTETEKEMMEGVRKCQAEIDANENLTAAEKTVAKRICEREITIRYESSEIDNSNPGELRAKLQNIQRCEDWYPQYDFLTYEQFKLQKNEEIVNDCILLYSDPIWDYDETDRPYKLIERLEEIKADLPAIPEPEQISLDMEIPQTLSPIIENPQKQDKITELEKKVKFLEEEVDRKDAIIKEQVKTIMDLFNRIRNVLFEPLNLSWNSF